MVVTLNLITIGSATNWVQQSWEAALVQEFSDFIIRQPGSIYARDYAVSNADVRNTTIKVLRDTQLNKDGVSLALETQRTAFYGMKLYVKSF